LSIACKIAVCILTCTVCCTALSDTWLYPELCCWHLLYVQSQRTVAGCGMQWWRCQDIWLTS